MPKGGKVGLRGGPSLRDAPYGLREDGTPKGKGFLGLIPTGKGNEVMSEKSMSIEIDGKETLIPLVIPGLTEDELNILKTTKGMRGIPDSLRNKAIDHAMDRMRKGLSPFAD